MRKGGERARMADARSRGRTRKGGERARMADARSRSARELGGRWVVDHLLEGGTDGERQPVERSRRREVSAKLAGEAERGVVAQQVAVADT